MPPSSLQYNFRLFTSELFIDSFTLTLNWFSAKNSKLPWNGRIKVAKRDKYSPAHKKDNERTFQWVQEIPSKFILCTDTQTQTHPYTGKFGTINLIWMIFVSFWIILTQMNKSNSLSAVSVNTVFCIKLTNIDAAFYDLNGNLVECLSSRCIIHTHTHTLIMYIF